MTPWQEWKKRNLEAQKAGKVTPTALLNPDTEYVDPQVSDNRLAICKECPHYMVTKQCSQCGCFMPNKTKLKYATCPKGLW